MKEIQKVTKARNGEIDLLKFLFAVIIVLFHSKNFASDGENIFKTGVIGVEFFFVTSGFLMAKSSSKVKLLEGESVGPPTVNFITRKIKGLIPEYYVAWVISFVVTAIAMGAGAKQLLENAALSIYELLFLTQSGLFGFRSNHVTWYISAMLLAMILLYPILIKKRTMFLTWIAPVIAIFLLGWLNQTFQQPLRAPSIWAGFAMKGFLRAIAELCLGVVCYTISEKIRQLKCTKLFSLLLFLIELVCLLFVLRYSYNNANAQLFYLMLFAIAVMLIITFSEKNIIANKLNHPLFGWLGNFSLSLYLSHGFWSQEFSTFFPDKSYWELFPYYILTAVATAFFTLYISKGIRYIWPHLAAKLKKSFIRPASNE